MDWQTILYAIKIPDEKRRKRFKFSVIRRFGGDVWITKDLSVIPVSLMKDSHIDNAWRRCAQAARDNYQKDNDYNFESRFNQVSMFKREYERRGRVYNVDEFKALKEIYDVLIRPYEDWDWDYQEDPYDFIHWGD